MPKAPCRQHIQHLWMSWHHHSKWQSQGPYDLGQGSCTTFLRTSCNAVTPSISRVSGRQTPTMTPWGNLFCRVIPQLGSHWWFIPISGWQGRLWMPCSRIHPFCLLGMLLPGIFHNNFTNPSPVTCHFSCFIEPVY